MAEVRDAWYDSAANAGPADTLASSTLRICHLGKYYPPALGGIETHVRALAAGQAAHGHDVRVVCVNHAGRRGRDVTADRYGMTPTIEQRDGAVRVTRLGRSAGVARLDVCPALPWLIKRINQDPPDILHLHTPNPTMVLVMAMLLRLRVPLVVTHHSDIVRQRVLRWFLDPFDRLVYRRASLILSDSAGYIEGSATLRHHLDRVRTLPLGVDLRPHLNPSARALACAADLRARHGAPLWLCVGRLVYYKGLEVALEALRHVPGTLLLVGRGPLESALRERTRKLGVTDRVRMAGALDEDALIGAYRAATALWFPSTARSEGFGLAQVEAMASGCPVVNTRLPGSGVSWVSLDGVSGLTVAPGDAGALAAAARRLHDDAALRARLAAGAAARARQEFDAALMASRALAFYARVLDDAAAAANSLSHRRVAAWVRAAGQTGDTTHAGAAPVRGQPVRRD